MGCQLGKRIGTFLTLIFVFTFNAGVLPAAFAETPSGAGSANNSLYFDSRNSTLIMSPGINVGTQPFTFESFFKTGPSINYGFFLGVAGGNGISINIQSATEIQVDAYGINATVFILTNPLQVNTWHHIAVARDSNNDETVWVDGIRASSSMNRWNNSLTYPAVYNDTRNYSGQSTGINTSTGCGHCNDGPSGNSTNDFAQVKITNYRFIVGSSIYNPNDSTITLPTTPLTNITNTKVLLNVTNLAGLITDSSGNQTISNNSVAFSAAEATAPSAPTSLLASASDGQATISFTAGSDGGSPITNYKYSLDGTNYTALSPSVTTSPITISGLTNGTTYNIYLKAVNNIGDGTASNSVSVTPIAPAVASSSSSPSSPASNFELTTTSSKGKMVVSWNDSSTLILSVYNKTTRKTNTKTLVGGLAAVTEPKPGQTAIFTLKNTYGEVLKTFTINSRPEAPKNVVVRVASSTLKVNWNKSVGATKYRVTITPNSGKPIVLITTDPNISIELGSKSKATLKIVAIGTNGTISKVIKKAF